MNIYPAKFGPFPNCIHFNNGEIDSLMEEHYLGYWNGTFDFEAPALNMENFVERYLSRHKVEFDPKASDFELGIGVLGKTIFNPDGLKIIQIQKSLYDNRNSTRYRGRYNFTAAHESFHALMHEGLFDFSDKQLKLDLKRKEETMTVCLKRDVSFHEEQSSNHFRKPPWQEIQANMGAAALLMPKTIFCEHFRREIKAYGLSCGADLVTRQDVFPSVAGYLSSTFGTSKLAVQFRILTLGLLQDGLQGEFEEMLGGEERR